MTITVVIVVGLIAVFIAHAMGRESAQAESFEDIADLKRQRDELCQKLSSAMKRAREREVELSEIRTEAQSIADDLASRRMAKRDAAWR